MHITILEEVSTNCTAARVNFNYFNRISGLMLWNSLAALASLVAVVTWIVQFYVKLRHNVLQRDDVANGGWTSSGKAGIGYSFWLVVIAAAFFILNVVVVQLMAKQRNQGSTTSSSMKKHLMMDSKPNGNLMLY